MSEFDIKKEIKDILVTRFNFDIGGKEYDKSASAYLYIAPDRKPSEYFGRAVRKIVEWEVRVTPEKNLLEIVAGVDTVGYDETVVKAFDITDNSPSGLFNLCDEVDNFFSLLYNEFDERYPDVYQKERYAELQRKYYPENPEKLPNTGERHE